MTDAADTGPAIRVIDTTSEAARRRVRTRYRAERRFKLYGLAAIGFSALFLVFLITDIVVKAMPSFTISSLSLEVPVKADTVNPDGSSDPAVIARGDFDKAVREALFARFPEASKERKSRRVIQGLLSSGAADGLRRRVVADPGLIGTTVPVDAILSDDADLYLKGLVTRTLRIAGTTNATPSATSGSVTILLDANALAGDLETVRQAMRQEGEVAQENADRVEASLGRYRARLAEAQSTLDALKSSGTTEGLAVAEANAQKLQSDVASLTSQVEGLRQRAETSLARANTTGGLERLDAALPSILIAINGGMVKATSIGADRIEGDVLLPLASTGTAGKGAWSKIVLETPEGNRKISDTEVALLETLGQAGLTRSRPNWLFFASGDSREAELAGILSSLVGSALTMIITLALCLPVGVLAAIYLEEFAPKNRLTDLVEVNINNLAAVPSIVFGLLGLAVFIGFFGVPSSSPLVGGLVLSLLVLPTIIIASRAALKAVPPSIREAALGVGASKQQAVFHHVLPLAAPGILTGTIIGMAHALGETAPLLMIGMIAFIVDVPTSFTHSATVLPVQIYLWSDLPEVGFQAKTAAAIIVLLLFLFAMNGLAILLRRRFERRW